MKHLFLNLTLHLISIIAICSDNDISIFIMTCRRFNTHKSIDRPFFYFHFSAAFFFCSSHRWYKVSRRFVYTENKNRTREKKPIHNKTHKTTSNRMQTDRRDLREMYCDRQKKVLSMGISQQRCDQKGYLTTAKQEESLVKICRMYKSRTNNDRNNSYSKSIHFL